MFWLRNKKIIFPVALLTKGLINQNFHVFLSPADFFQNHLFQNSFKNTIRVSNSLDPDQVGHFVWPDLVPNCLQKVSADDTRN